MKIGYVLATSAMTIGRSVAGALGSKRSFLVAFVLGSFASVGCIGSTGESAIELENARISQAGELLVVTGFVNGREETVTASDVTFVDRDGNVITGPDSLTCWVCVCENGVCVCAEIECPKKQEK